MPSPSTASAFDARPDLLAAYIESDLSTQDQGLRITDLYTPLEVNEQAGTQPVITRESLLSIPETLRAEDALYPEDDFETEDRLFATKEQGLVGKCSVRRSQRFKSWFDLELIVLARTMHRWKLRREYDGIAVATDSTVYAGALTSAATAAMSVVATATPVANITAAVNAVFDQTGEWCNCVSMSRKTFREMRMTDEFREYLSSKGAGNPDYPGAVTTEVMAQVLDLDEVIVFGAAKNTANPGQAGSIASLWPDTKVLVARKAVTASPDEACVGRMMHWDGDGSQIDGLVETSYDDDYRSNKVRVRGDNQFLGFTTELAHLITGF